MTTTFFEGARHVVFEGSASFNSVTGNQVINNFQGKQKRRKKKRTEYDRYHRVKQGDIYRYENMGVCSYPKYLDKLDKSYLRGSELRADKTICAAEVMGVQGRVFTAVSYTGPDAKEAFEEDFRTFSGTVTASSFQVYGVDTQVPTVLFHHILQPVANFLGGLGFWGRFYLRELQRQFDWCRGNEMWLDSQRGVVCRGPAGPDCRIPRIPSNLFFGPNGLLIPESAEHLHGDIYLRFLARQKSKDIDRAIVDAFSNHCHDRFSEVGVRQPTIFSTRTNAAIPVGGGVWEEEEDDECLGERVVMESGEKRFTLEGTGRLFIETDWREERIAWMSQALSIFHALGVSLDDDLKNYELIAPNLLLKSRLSESDHLRQRRRQQPIHLFMRRLSPSTPSDRCRTSALHYWSFDPTGGHPLSAETCSQLGLPTELSLEVYPPRQYHWDNEAYRAIHEYQLARRFDPTTTDFARHLGYPTYSVQNDRDRFEELPSSSCSSSD